MNPTKTLLMLIVAIVLFGFDSAKETKSFTIKGKVKSEINVDFAALQKHTLYTIGSVNIVNHKGDVKGKAKDLKGVLIRDILKSVALDEDNAKLYSEYYFVCKASDGYKVVYSWNELFNTAIGNSVYIVLEREGKNLIDSDDSLLMVSTEDVRTGRRYLKNLESINVCRAE
jgi:ABC-type Na+ efflux pump permease subunit